jgi:hypothetical protein
LDITPFCPTLGRRLKLARSTEPRGTRPRRGADDEAAGRNFESDGKEAELEAARSINRFNHLGKPFEAEDSSKCNSGNLASL